MILSKFIKNIFYLYIILLFSCSFNISKKCMQKKQIEDNKETKVNKKYKLNKDDKDFIDDNNDQKKNNNNPKIKIVIKSNNSPIKRNSNTQNTISYSSSVHKTPSSNFNLSEYSNYQEEKENDNDNLDIPKRPELRNDDSINTSIRNIKEDELDDNIIEQIKNLPKTKMLNLDSAQKILANEEALKDDVIIRTTLRNLQTPSHNFENSYGNVNEIIKSDNQIQLTPDIERKENYTVSVLRNFRSKTPEVVTIKEFPIHRGSLEQDIMKEIETIYCCWCKWYKCFCCQCYFCSKCCSKKYFAKDN